MTKKIKSIQWLTLALVVAFAATSAHARDARMRRLVVVGDSLLAGFSSGGFVTRGHAGQVDSAPAFLARRAGVSFPQPLMSNPGVPSAGFGTSPSRARIRGASSTPSARP